jgi:hypothetical protein
MASQTLSKMIVLCILIVAGSFTLMSLLSDLPKTTESAVTEIQNPHSELVTTKEIHAPYSPPRNWKESSGEISDSQLEKAILGVDAPVNADAEAEAVDPENVLLPLAGVGGDIGLIDEEKLREQIVKEDPTWVSWQKMNQVRYLSLLTGQSSIPFYFCFCCTSQ